jgi:RNA polymerase sigma-70 factor, ECF subfamily
MEATIPFALADESPVAPNSAVAPCVQVDSRESRIHAPSSSLTTRTSPPGLPGGERRLDIVPGPDHPPEPGAGRPAGHDPPPDARPDVTGPPDTEFREVVRPHLPWLYGLACRLVGDRAEDAVQDCLVKAFRGFDRLRDHQASAAWLRQILVNVVRDMARHDARQADEVSVEELDESTSLYRRLADEDPLPYSDSLHLDFLSCFTVPDVWAVLDRLPARYRTPLVLVHMYGVPTAEVAKALDLPQGTLLSQLHRGRRRFERELWDYAEQHDLLSQRAGAMP